MSVGRRREMIEPEHPQLSIIRQCALLSISRSAYYVSVPVEYSPKVAAEKSPG